MEHAGGRQMVTTTLESKDTAEKISLLTSCVASLSQRVDQLQDEVTQLKQEMNSSRKHSYEISSRAESSDMTSNMKSLRSLSNSEVCVYILLQRVQKKEKRLCIVYECVTMYPSI